MNSGPHKSESLVEGLHFEWYDHHMGTGNRPDSRLTP